VGEEEEEAKEKAEQRDSSLGYKNRAGGHNTESLQQKYTEQDIQKLINSFKTKMGIVAFEWAEGKTNQLTLLMNRDNWENRQV